MWVAGEGCGGVGGGGGVRVEWACSPCGPRLPATQTPPRLSTKHSKSSQRASQGSSTPEPASRRPKGAVSLPACRPAASRPGPRRAAVSSTPRSALRTAAGKEAAPTCDGAIAGLGRMGGRGGKDGGSGVAPEPSPRRQTFPAAPPAWPPPFPLLSPPARVPSPSPPPPTGPPRRDRPGRRPCADTHGRPSQQGTAGGRAGA